METQTGKSKSKKLLRLFLATLYISAFTFGGGFVIVTFMKRKFVDELHWIDESEMLDLIAIAQSSPGAIAVNAAILVGWRAGGFPGMLVGVFGTILPPMLILGVISFFYNAFAENIYVALVLKGMQAGVAAVIADVVIDLGGRVVKERSAARILIMAAAFAAVVMWDVNVIYVILAAALVGVAGELIRHGKEKRKKESESGENAGNSDNRKSEKSEIAENAENAENIENAENSEKSEGSDRK